MNAQRKCLDVWLIYKCSQCDATWNAAVFSRVNPQSIDPALLERFHRNDWDTANRYAADVSLLRRNGAEAGLPEYRIQGEPFSLEEETELEIRCDFHLPVKLSTLVRQVLPLSGSAYAELVQNGQLTCPDGRDPIKGKVRTGIVLRFRPDHPLPDSSLAQL